MVALIFNVRYSLLYQPSLDICESKRQKGIGLDAHIRRFEMETNRIVDAHYHFAICQENILACLDISSGTLHWREQLSGGW